METNENETQEIKISVEKFLLSEDHMLIFAVVTAADRSFSCDIVAEAMQKKIKCSNLVFGICMLRSLCEDVEQMTNMFESGTKFMQGEYKSNLN